jgi:hypothetical protein
MVAFLFCLLPFAVQAADFSVRPEVPLSQPTKLPFWITSDAASLLGGIRILRGRHVVRDQKIDASKRFIALTPKVINYQ